MKRHIILENGVRFKRYNTNSWSVELEISPDIISPLLLEIQLLCYSHADTLTIKSKENLESIIIKIADEKSSVHCKNNKYVIHLLTHDIEVISSYLLQYYRDGYATVNHIDIELHHDGEFGQDSTFIIKSTNTMEPMSGDEARKILGIE